MKITERIFDAITGETTDIERDATAQEILDFEKTELKITELKAKEAKREAAEAKLAALGLTSDDLKALGLQAQSPKIVQYDLGT